MAVNLSLEHGFQRFTRRVMDEDGAVGYDPYNRFPIGGYAAMKAATLPFGGSLSDQLTAARVLILLFYAAAAVLAYLSLCRIASNRWIALTATLLAFSSFHLLYYNDMTANEVMPDLFGVMLTFHGMVVFVQEGRFRQLLVKACIALLLGWHVLALVLPFVIFGLASELLRARSADSLRFPTALHWGKHAASTLLRSRYLLFGAVALGFGLCVLTFNFTMEYVALGGETPLTELPSFQSMLKRASVDQGVVRASYPWGAFLELQFLRIFLMFIPYALIGSGGILESPAWQTQFQGALIPAVNVNAVAVSEWLSKFQAVVLGVGLSGACLIGSMFVRQRMLFATLASFGFFWTLPMRQTTYDQGFESVYYIGLPLVFFTVVLLLARRLIKRDGVIAAASVAALLLFAASSFQMSHIGYSAEAAQAARAAEQDIRTIRESVAGEHVTVLNFGGNYTHFFDWAGYAMSYYLNESILRYRRLPPGDHGFVVMRERVDTDALLTPQNQYLFLYDTAGLTAWYRSRYRSVISTEPLARKEFDVYFIDGTVYYLREACDGSNFIARLFLHVFPAALDDLSEDRRQHGFDNFDFTVRDRGLLFDGKCLASVDLPQYDIASFRTGRVGADGVWVWNAAQVVQGPELISAYQAIVSSEPVVRSEFDLYIDGGTLYHVKEPCVEEDTATRFFLHVVPEDENDLPGYRREHGFDNLDFGFDERGVVFDGKCAAAVSLPQYGIAGIVTGQYDGVERVWEVEFAP